MMIALGLAIVAQFGLVIASFVFSAMSVPTGTSWIAAMAEPLAFGTVTLTFPTVGAVVLLRRPSHPIGRLMSIVALGWALGNASSRFAQYALVARGGAVPGGEWALWLSAAWTIVASSGLLLLIMLLFPTGSLLSPSWRPVAWVVGVWTAVTCLAFAFAGGRLENDLGVVISNPAAAPDPIGAGLAAMAEPLQGGVLVLFAVAAISPLIRFRRSRGIERQQLKWIAGAVLIVLVLFVTAIATAVLLDIEVTSRGPVVGGWLRVFFGVVTMSFGLLPVAIGVAVLRYRLYEIDRIVNRTLVYAALTITLGLVYVGLVVVLGGLLRPVTGSNELAVAGSTLVVAALFTPARRRIQGFVDRQFHRSRYDAARIVEAYSARLRDQVDLQSLTSDLVAVARRTLEPAHLSVWIRPSDRGR